MGGLNVSGWFSIVKCKTNIFSYSIACTIGDSEDRYFLEMNYVDESQISLNQAPALLRSWISIPMELRAMRTLPIYCYHRWALRPLLNRMSAREREEHARWESKQMDLQEAKEMAARFKEYKPDVKLSYKDEFGWKMSQKEVRIHHFLHWYGNGNRRLMYWSNGCV